MIILAVVKKKKRTSSRGRKIGQEVLHRVGVGFDRFNVIIAEATTSNFTSRKFYPNLRFLAKDISAFGVSIEDLEKILRDAFAYAFERTLPDKMTIEELDREFTVSKRTNDSTGALLIYRVLKEKWCKDDSCDDGDLILWEKI